MFSGFEKKNMFYIDFELLHMDEFIDELLRDERACDIILPRIQASLFVSP